MPTAHSVTSLWFLIAGLSAIGCASAPSHADVSTFYGEAWRATWLAQAGGSPTTIGFAGLAIGSQVTDQYAAQGVYFDLAGTAGYQPGFDSDGWVRWNHHGSTDGPIQPNDGLRATFENPMHAFAMEQFSPSAGFHLTLYHGDAVVWTGTFGGFDVEGYEWPWTFSGIVSDQAFDGVWMTALPSDPSFPGGPNYVMLDTLMFSTVPGPGAALLFAIGAGARPRSRRR